MTTAEQKINALFSELVPASGKADTVAGEIVRAVSRIGYRNYNDGDHIGVGYGKEGSPDITEGKLTEAFKKAGTVLRIMKRLAEEAEQRVVE